MRKKTILLSMLLPLAALIAACSGQEDITPEQPPQLPETQLRPMTFRAQDGAATRAEGEIPFDGERYPIIMSAKFTKAEGNNFQDLTLDWMGNDFNTAVATGKYYPKTGTMKFYAYSTTESRVKSQWLASGDGFEVDYSKHAVSGRDNIMYDIPDTIDLTTEFQDPTLHFKHAMAKLKIKMKQTPGFVVRMTNITFVGMSANGKLNVTKDGTGKPVGNWTLNTENITEATMGIPHGYNIDEKSTEYQLVDSVYMIPEQYFDHIKVDYLITDKEKHADEYGSYTYELKSPTKLAMGSVRSLELRTESLILAHGELSDRYNESPYLIIFPGYVSGSVTDDETSLDDKFDNKSLLSNKS